MDRNVLGQKAGGFLKRLGAYKFVLIVIAAGLALLLWPERSPQAAVPADAAGETSGSASPPEIPAACCTVTGSSREKSSACLCFIRIAA